MRDCEAKHDVGMEIKVIWLVQARKIWIAASKFDLFLQTQFNKHRILFCRPPEVCIYYSAELDGHHHSGYLVTFCKQSQKVIQKKVRDSFGVQVASFAARLLIASLQMCSISRLLYPQVGHRYSLIVIPCQTDFCFDMFIQVTNWVLGSGESYLANSNDIGDSVISCEILRKEHEEFELSARVREIILM